MPLSNPKYRRPLKPAQVEVLQLLYRFRFTTTELIASYQHKKNAAAVFNRMRVLCEQEYIGRNFSSSYRLLGKPASYYLLPKGIQVLREDPDNAAKVLHSLYKDKTASEQFIAQSLTLFQTYLKLTDLYGDALDLFTKSELTTFDYFPKKQPDAYISLKGKNKGRTKHYVLLVVDEATPHFAAVKRVQGLIHHAETGKWSVALSGPPIVLIVADTIKQQKALQPRLARAIEAAKVENPRFYLACKERVAALTPESDDSWQSVTDPILLRSLRTM